MTFLIKGMSLPRDLTIAAHLAKHHVEVSQTMGDIIDYSSAPALTPASGLLKINVMGGAQKLDSWSVMKKLELKVLVTAL